MCYGRVTQSSTSLIYLVLKPRNIIFYHLIDDAKRIQCVDKGYSINGRKFESQLLLRPLCHEAIATQTTKGGQIGFFEVNPHRPTLSDRDKWRIAELDLRRPRHQST